MICAAKQSYSVRNHKNRKTKVEFLALCISQRLKKTKQNSHAQHVPKFPHKIPTKNVVIYTANIKILISFNTCFPSAL